MMLSLANLVFVVLAKPYETPHANNTEIFNELVILAVSEHLYLFTDFIDDPEQ